MFILIILIAVTFFLLVDSLDNSMRATKEISRQHQQHHDMPSGEFCGQCYYEVTERAQQ